MQRQQALETRSKNILRTDIVYSSGEKHKELLCCRMTSADIKCLSRCFKRRTVSSSRTSLTWRTKLKGSKTKESRRPSTTRQKFKRKKYASGVSFYCLICTALQSVNETIKFEVNEMRSRLRIEEFEKRIETYLSKNQTAFEEKSRIMDDLQTASQYILELEEKIHSSNSTSLELLK